MAKKFPKEKRVYISLGFQYRMRQMYDKAIINFNKALELDPEFSNAYNFLAYTYAEMGNYEKAIEYYERYASLSPGDANPFDSMGELYFKLGELDNAIDKFKEAIEVKPGFGSELNIAYIYALKENYTEAMKWIDNFITSNPAPGKKAQGYLWKGFYHLFLGQYRQSLIDFSEVKELMRLAGNDYGVAVATIVSGCVYLERKEFKLSRICFEESKVVVKSFGYSYDILACIQMLTRIDILEGKIDSAKSKLAVSEPLIFKLTEKNKYLGTHLKSGRNCLRMEIMLAEGDFKNAVALGEKPDSLEMVSMGIKDLIARNIPFVQDVLARAYYLNGELEKAIAEYERLITFDPTSNNRLLIRPKYHYRLAKLNQEKGWKEKAIGEFEKFLEFWKDADKDLPELADAKSRLAKLVSK